MMGNNVNNTNAVILVTNTKGLDISNTEELLLMYNVFLGEVDNLIGESDEQ